MTSIIKNQIIKHLSKFARNITTAQISVQILSGKGELKNIELNEVVLSEVLELPAWLRIKRAICDRIAVKVPWTKLKSRPVQLFIDEIWVEVEISSDEVINSGTNPLSSTTDSSYGFADRVVEGMSLYVNSVEINFDSGVFRGALTLSRLAVESRSPSWQSVNDLRHSRLVDSATEKLLMFKMVTWQLLRIEASSEVLSPRNMANAPLRLITSSGKSRITVKKSTVDGSVLGGRIQVILDDILWIATLPQVRSAVSFYNHIMSIIKASPWKMSTMQRQHSGVKSPVVSKSPSSNPVSNGFRNFDFQQTSFHIYVGKIDLHLCDDNQSMEGYPADWNIVCGALQVTLLRLSVDFYPSNNALADRSDWVRYDIENQCAAWTHIILQSHLRKLGAKLDGSGQIQLLSDWSKMLSQNCVIRMYDIIVQCVSDINSKKETLFNLFMSDRKSRGSVPNDKPLFHLELTSFYHPKYKHFSVPSCITHLLLGPFFFIVHQRTIRWVLFVFDDIRHALQISNAAAEMGKMPKTYVRVDLLMPKIIIPSDELFVPDMRFARRIIISMSTVLATNHEAVCFDEFSSFLQSASTVVDFANTIDLLVDKEKLKRFIIQLRESSNSSSDSENDDSELRIWISTSPLWIDTDSGDTTQSIPLLADVAFNAVINVSTTKVDDLHPFSNWCKNCNFSQGQNIEVSVALQSIWKIQVAVDHFQFLQIKHLFTSMSEFVNQLVADQKCFSSTRGNGNGVAVGIVCFIEEAEINIILPAQRIPTPYDSPRAIFQLSMMSSNHVDESTQRACVISPSALMLEQKTTSSLTATTPPTTAAFQKATTTEVFPEFPQQIDSEVSSAADETMSLTTNISEDEQQSVTFDATDDDIFHEEVIVAEEAFVDEVTVNPSKLQNNFTKHVNVLTLVMSDLNMVVSVLNNVARGAGYITNFGLQQSLNKILKELYVDMTGQANHQTAEKVSWDSGKASAHFHFWSPSNAQFPSFKVKVDGLRAALDEIVVSHLSAFIYDDEQTDVPLNLHINLADANIVIKDPRTKPLRIKVRDCVIEQAADDDDLDN